MTVAEFIVWLQTQDQGATVEVVKHEDGTGYYDQGGTACIVPFDPCDPSLFDYTDMRVYSLKPEHNQRTLLLGQYNG
jgi:hypothetical protein